ncbi:ATP-binding protein [Saccharothrix luteola]|uniref:ATP-binding protein n=1 Tax=Saccharothrix luteola TaxID=2893018 RepID=UPI001E489ADA|nr:ATP-binding protein [Saccharothrix luteola]MCC8249939.1 ATP-binding protein [Saccharothrix luteola]
MDVVERSADHVDFDLEDRVPPVRRARRWITENVPELDRPALLDLLLIADALLTNAFEHAEAPRRLRLSHRPDAHVVRVEVHDGSPELLPVLGKPGGLEPHHRGLLLVNRVASRWGVDPQADHKAVWGEVAA